jgi:hypothetical protein
MPERLRRGGVAADMSCQCSPQVRPPSRPVQADAEQRCDRVPDHDQVRLCSSRARLPFYEHGNWNEVSESFVPAQAYPCCPSTVRT